MDVPLSERERWLERLAGDDIVIKPWLARVLGSDAGMETGFLRERTDLTPPRPFEPGAAIGPYKLESRLGEGGMGEVWRASRADDGPRREVALKLPHRELLGGPFRQRFARERDVLAALSHPHIAQLYDAGLSADGHPYLALELVEGQPINEACAAQHASLNQRVELVRQVLEALTYAHQRLIVHRDIKPTNVMVTPQGGVKLLDFGIAKLLHPTDARDAGLTQAAARLATPAYAAPEQLTDGEITVATDIFSVGVLLFELCAGHRPFTVPPVGQDAREAPLASHRANAESTGMSDGGRLSRALRGDIDAIIARALALDPGARYSSAEAFARDLERWRDGLPVAARRVGWAMLSLKFVRRNKVGVALAAVLALALIGGTAGIAWQARRAEHEAARANAVKDYLIGLFEQGDPNSGGKPSETMTVKELLDHGAEQVDKALAGQPETEMELLDTLSQIYNSLEDSSRATQADARRLELARALYGADDPRVVNRTIDLAENRSLFLDPAGAQALLQSIRRSVFTHYRADSLERARWLETWAESLRTTHGARDEALADASQAVAILGAHFPENDAYPYALYALASFQYDAEQWEASLATQQKYRDALAARGNAAGLDRLEYLTMASNTLRHLGRYDEAEKLLEENQTLAARMLGRENSFYLSGLLTKALIANDLGQRDQAMAMFAEGIAIVAGKGVAPGWRTAFHTYYGAALAAGGDAASAIPILENALRQTELHPTEEFSLRHAQSLLGDAYDQAGRAAEARALLQTVRNDSVRYDIPAGEHALGARERWARFLLDHGEQDAAGAECNDILGVAAGVASAPAALARADLARIALAHGDSTSADRLSEQAIQTIDAVKLGYDVRARTDIWLTRAETLLANGQRPQAAKLAARALAAAQGSDTTGSPRLARARAIVRKSQ
jgi:serine/threonine-protein kinase